MHCHWDAPYSLFLTFGIKQSIFFDNSHFTDAMKKTLVVRMNTNSLFHAPWHDCALLRHTLKVQCGFEDEKKTTILNDNLENRSSPEDILHIINLMAINVLLDDLQLFYFSGHDIVIMMIFGLRWMMN